MKSMESNEMKNSKVNVEASVSKADEKDHKVNRSQSNIFAHGYCTELKA